MDKRVLFLVLFIVFCAGVPAIAQTCQIQNSGTTDDFKGVAFTDSLHGWAVGGGNNGGSIFCTTDGGTTWNQQPLPQQEFGLYRVAMSNPQFGWAVGMEGTILHTSDGHTWEQQDLGITAGCLDVAFPNDSTGWIMGGALENGWDVRRTTDRGATWVAQPVGQVSHQKGFVFADATTGWMVGYSGSIMRTTDGGSTWEQQPCANTGYLFDGAFTNANTGWVVGYEGAILHTTDGGDTWIQQTSGSTAYLSAAAFTANTTGWVVGDGGTILRTENGGDTWENQPSGTTAFLSDVTFLNNGMGWAVGSSGTILRYTPPAPDQVKSATAIPGDFFLAPNFPNPFNPGTTLRFGVPQAADVSLEVFDMLGRKVATLRDGIAQPGVHSVSWTCPGCASGTYLARLRYAGRTLQQPMLLLK
ncbi:MAG TPA: YCF48-related protein [bacterium]|jgi:photosystem II stability/assembly factor-like uncharacterized protein